MPTPPRTNPFTILIDQREKAPWKFTGINDARSFYRPFPVVVPVKYVHLPTADYAIEGHHLPEAPSGGMVIERKSKVDLYSTLVHHRDRFEAELKRMSRYRWACVIVEASLEEIATQPPEETRIKPQSVTGAMFALMQRYPSVGWLHAWSRRSAEKIGFRLLERFWRDFCDEQERNLANGIDSRIG